MTLADRVNTFGQDMVARYGERVHKIAIDAGFSCPNRDGSKGRGGCTFCNNVSFSPNGRSPQPIPEQIAAGKQVIHKRTRARKFIAYFQAYTNTYDDIERLRAQYDQALAEPDIIGLSVGTRPDCVPPAVLDLLAEYRDRGFEIWLELGLQSIFDATLERVNRGHSLVEYEQAIRGAQARYLNICTHLIVGLPGETERHVMQSLDHVLALGVQGLKLHPLHVVKGTRLANDWRRGAYRPLSYEQYIHTAADLIERTPPDIIYHRITATASRDILLAPDWCACKWKVLNGIESVLRYRHTRQGSHCGTKLCPSTVLDDSRADNRRQFVAHTL
ncbi:MAG: TIGR01212 family radical SAM protein [Gammaproteobacteria bacterium]|nr:MAG: TIGR01212 family radical SAM protein [Gammaproteobacteria bacterium]